MKINTNQQNFKTPSYKGLWNNKTVLRGLETISEHGTTFIAATTLAMSVGVRPLAIQLTPDVKKENKHYSITNLIASGLIKFALVEAVAIPVEQSIKKIDKNPEKYLTQTTIDNLKTASKPLVESKNYKFATQILKQSSNLITAIPKAMLTVSLIPVIMKLLYNNSDKSNKTKQTEKINQTKKSSHQIKQEQSTSVYNTYNKTFSNDFNQPKQKTTSFKGLLTDQTAKNVSKILNNETYQNIVKKFSSKDKDIARNMSIATDLLLTASFIHRTNKNDKIEKERKKPLIYNNLISTGITLLAGYSIDKLIQKNTQNFIDKFSQINKNDPKLNKYIEGINILRPTLIFAALYYAILPIFSTYIADKADNFTQKNKVEN
jgi:hypothetical protein